MRGMRTVLACKRGTASVADVRRVLEQREVARAHIAFLVTTWESAPAAHAAADAAGSYRAPDGTTYPLLRLLTRREVDAAARHWLPSGKLNIVLSTLSTDEASA